MAISENIINHISLNNELPILKIVSPFLSKKHSKELINLVNKINPKIIKIYTRDSNYIPQEFNEINIPVEIYKPVKKSSKNNFHSKMFLLETKNKLQLFMGSANFTEQGFFLSARNGGNQECGIIISTDDTEEIKNINDWFSNGWEKPIDINSWNSSNHEFLYNEFNEEIYAYAIRNKNDVELFVMDPDFSIIEQEIIINNKKVKCSRNEDHLFRSTLKEIKNNVEMLKVKIKEEEFIVKIFDPLKFKEWISINDDSLFSFQLTGVESLNSEILSRAIENDGIKVGTAGNIIIEPPKLEQFYKNVRYHTEAIKRRKFFTKYHLSELINELEPQNGGMGIYLIMQLIKSFKYVESKNNIELEPFIQVCKSKLNILLDELNIKQKSYYSFLNVWLNNE